MDAYALLFASTLSAGTVLALASLGLLINEKVGIVNLGAEAYDAVRRNGISIALISICLY